MTIPRTLSLMALGLLALGAAARPAGAQDADPRWAPWIGCWEPAEADDAGKDLLCVRPAAAGVEVSEVADGAVRATYALAADGRAYPVELEGCAGTRTAEFSADGRRIFTVNTESCDGEPALASTGLIAMVSPDEWIDVQAAQEDGRGLGWMRRYRAARPQAAADAGFGDVADRTSALRRRPAAAARVDVDDVIEAVRRVDPEGVRTWIAQLDEPFQLDRRQLLRLADAHVPPSVIDVMVAVSYPDRFALSRDGDIDEMEPRGPAAPDRGPRGYGGRRRGFFWPTYWDPYYGYYGRGYYGRGYYDGYYGPGVVVVEPRSSSPDARVVKGKGYTRGGGSRGDGGAATGGAEGGGSSRAPARSSGSSGSGSSGSGSSEGSGSDSGSGRHAKPR